MNGDIVAGRKGGKSLCNRFHARVPARHDVLHLGQPIVLHQTQQIGDVLFARCDHHNVDGLCLLQRLKRVDDHGNAV